MAAAFLTILNPNENKTYWPLSRCMASGIPPIGIGLRRAGARSRRSGGSAGYTGRLVIAGGWCCVVPN